MKKMMVVGIIILFISVSIAPSINANIDSSPIKSKLVETAIRIHKSNGIIPYTLKLTEKESDEIDRIFDNLKVSLDSAETGEEIDAIYESAVESLYELGMFPRMTLREAKQLVNGDSKKSQSINVGTRGENFNCQISGTTSECFIYGVGRLFLGGILLTLILAFQRMINRRYNFPSFNGRIGMMSLGTYYAEYDSYNPSYGWVHTNGTNGVIKWGAGGFYGNIDYWEEVYEYPHDLTFTTGYYQGVDEFNGLWTQKSEWSSSYFIGNAEHVSLSSTPSWP